jgi:hypothetical protein
MEKNSKKENNIAILCKFIHKHFILIELILVLIILITNTLIFYELSNRVDYTRFIGQNAKTNLNL